MSLLMRAIIFFIRIEYFFSFGYNEMYFFATVSMFKFDNA